MQLLKITPLLLILFSAYMSSAQPCAIKYSYDAAGNRVKRQQTCLPPESEKAGNDELNEVSQNEKDKLPVEDEFDIAVLFPNPTSSTCIVSLNKPVSGATLSLFDNQGKMVQYQYVNGQDLHLDLSRLSAGPYFVIVKTETKSVHRTVVRN